MKKRTYYCTSKVFVDSYLRHTAWKINTSDSFESFVRTFRITNVTNWKEKSLLKNVKMFYGHLLKGNLQVMADSHGSSATAFLTSWDKILVECFNALFREGEM